MDERIERMLADPIIGHSLFVHTCGGVRDYLLRRKTSALLMRAQTTKAVLGLIPSADGEQLDPNNLTPEQQAEINEAVPKLMVPLLREAMVFPCLAPEGEKTEPGVQYAIDDLGDDALECFVAVMGDGSEALPMPDSSEDQAGATP